MKIKLICPPLDSMDGLTEYTKDFHKSLNQHMNSELCPFQSQNMNLYEAVIFSISTIRNEDLNTVFHLQYDPGNFSNHVFPVNLPGFTSHPLFVALSNRPVVTTVHELPDESMFGPYGSWHIRFIKKRLSIVSNTLIFHSDKMMNEFYTNTATAEMRVVPHGINLSEKITLSESTAKSRFNYSTDEEIISLPGHIYNRKGHLRFLELAEMMPNTSFMIAGGLQQNEAKSYYEKVKLKASSLENVQITGQLNSERFHSVFIASDIIVLPYRDIRQSGILNYAAAYHCPTVTSEIPYFININNKWGNLEMYSPPDNIDMLYNAVQNVMIEPRKSELQVKMAQYAQDNSFEQVVREYVDIYSSLLR